MPCVAHKVLVLAQVLPVAVLRATSAADFTGRLREVWCGYLDIIDVIRTCMKHQLSETDIRLLETKTGTVCELLKEHFFPKLHYFLHTAATIRRYAPVNTFNLPPYAYNI